MLNKGVQAGKLLEFNISIEMQAVLKHIKYWTSLKIKEMKIKTILKCYFSPVRLAKIWIWEQMHGQKCKEIGNHTF